MKTEPVRCGWAGTDPLMVGYHDEEWGVPVHDDRTMFEFVVLEGAQAGLSWMTILKRRPAYRKAFAGFEPARVARFTAARIERLLGDATIIRNRSKIEAAVGNARAALEVAADFDGLCNYFWSFVGGSPIVNRRERMQELPAATDLSTALARDMKQRGFAFFGPVIAYAHMQATGMVNDHVIDCHRWAALAG